MQTHFQSVKNKDPQLDFYNMYKREVMDYDTERMYRLGEDVGNILILVRPCRPFAIG